MLKKGTPARRLLLVASSLYLIGYFVWGVGYAQKGDWTVLEFIPFLLVFAFCFLLVMYCLQVKRMLITMFSSYDYRSATPDEFPDLDALELERLTTEWESLGFAQRGDSEGYSANPKLGNWFSRIFENESEGAIVQVLQQFTPTKTLPFNSSLASLWVQSDQQQSDRLELERRAEAIPPIASPLPPQPQKLVSDQLNFWSYSTHNRAPNRYFGIMKHPRVLGARLEPTATPAQMWEFHQKRAALIETRLGTTALRGDIAPLLRAHGRVLNDILARRLRKTPAWKLAIYSLNRKPIPAITDGELAPLEQ